ncbi:MAG: hypothetical protein FWH05_01295 [Oscillospiraceae bacterium]|nr:hypothetical protein [Oscillospiraceae bacterium]
MEANTNQKQRCINIIERFPEEQLAMLADSLENMHKMLDEAFDMAFCVSLAELHKNNNPAHIEDDFSSIEDVANRLGVNLNGV